MRKLGVKTAILLAAASVIVVGLLGAYSYGRDYYLHRGFAALVPLPRAGTGRLLAVNYYSTALHRRADYMVYLPPGYSPRHRYPVYYLLHGTPGQPKVFVDIANMDVRLDNQLALGHAAPDDPRLSRRADRRQRLLGFRVGQHRLRELRELRARGDAQRRPAVLDAASSPGPRDRGLFGRRLRRAQHRAAPPLGTSPTYSPGRAISRRRAPACSPPQIRPRWRTTAPWTGLAQLGRSLVRYPLRVYLFAGRSDPASRQQPVIVNSLSARGAQVQARLYPGGHDWSVWYPRLNQMLDLASSDFARPRDRRPEPPRRPCAPAWTSRHLRSDPPGRHRAVDLSGAPPPAARVRAAAAGRPAAGADLGRPDQPRVRASAARSLACPRPRPAQPDRRLPRPLVADRSGRRLARLRGSDHRCRAGSPHSGPGLQRGQPGSLGAAGRPAGRAVRESRTACGHRDHRDRPRLPSDRLRRRSRSPARGSA